MAAEAVAVSDGTPVGEMAMKTMVEGGRARGPRLAALGMLVWALLCLPVLRWWGERFGDGSDEPLGVLALAMGLGLLWVRQERLRISAAGLAVGASLLVVQAMLPLPMLVKGALAVAALSAGLSLPLRMPGVAALLMLSLPVVASLQFYLGFPLRWLAAGGTAALLSGFGVEVVQTGTVLLVGGREVGVDAACSGVRMLWTGLLVAAWFSARNGFSFWDTALLLGTAVGLVVGANAVRAAVLFFPEAGWVCWADWTHDAVGVLCFAGVAVGVLRVSEWLGKGGVFAWGAPAGLGWCLLVAGACVGGVGMKTMSAGELGVGETQRARDWPREFEGEGLSAVALSEREQVLARSFPGEWRVFGTESGRTVIVREVRRATRSLHSSADCLRASGYKVTPAGAVRDEVGERWSSHHVSGDGRLLRLREKLVSADGKTFEDVSAWYWSAVLGRSTGPWWSYAVIEPVEEG